MKATEPEIRTLSLEGLTLAPSQVWGSVRIVPVLRATPITDLRLHRQCVASFARVALDGPLEVPSLAYYAYVPHAFVVQWGEGDELAASYGTKLEKPGDDKHLRSLPWMTLIHRVARRERGGLRFLPLHMALEGFLALQFGGPSVVWKEYSEHAIRHGLSPRMEWVLTGRAIDGLDDALRVFEIHDRQVGVLLFVGDSLASAFVVPNHADYRILHRSLLMDFFADTILWNAIGYPEVPDWTIDPKGVEIRCPTDLDTFLRSVRRDWAEFHGAMADGLFGAPLTMTRMRRLGRFTLERFLPSLDPNEENHLGEAILDDQGQLAYLKTFRLSAAQVRRGFLLKQLAVNEWSLDACAAALGTRPEELILRLRNAGFAYLLKDHVIAAAETRLERRH